MRAHIDLKLQPDDKAALPPPIQARNLRPQFQEVHQPQDAKHHRHPGHEEVDDAGPQNDPWPLPFNQR